MNEQRLERETASNSLSDLSDNNLFKKTKTYKKNAFTPVVLNGWYQFRFQKLGTLYILHASSRFLDIRHSISNSHVQERVNWVLG